MGKSLTKLKPDDVIEFTMNFKYHVKHGKNDELSYNELIEYFTSSAFINTINSYMGNNVLFYYMLKDVNIKVEMDERNIKDINIKKNIISLKMRIVLLENYGGKERIRLKKLFDIYDSNLEYYVPMNRLLGISEKYRNRAGDIEWKGFTGIDII
jgi:hypothetical protein